MQEPKPLYWTLKLGFNEPDKLHIRTYAYQTWEDLVAEMQAQPMPRGAAILSIVPTYADIVMLPGMADPFAGPSLDALDEALDS